MYCVGVDISGTGVVNKDGKISFRKECFTNVGGGFECVMDDINKKGLLTCVNLGWYEVDFIGALNNRFRESKVYAENDATVAAIAESKFGSMKNKDIAIMYTLGTGVGGCIIINGKAITGSHGMGSEIGHTINRFKSYLAKAMANMINILDPDVISIGAVFLK